MDADLLTITIIVSDLPRLLLVNLLEAPFFYWIQLAKTIKAASTSSLTHQPCHNVSKVLTNLMTL